MLFSQNNWSRSALIALFITYLFIGPLAAALFFSDISIDSDLRSLSPEYTKLQELEAIIEESASIAERRIQFVLLSKSESQLEDAYTELEEMILEIEGLQEPDFESKATNYLDIVKDHPRNFLTDSDFKKLQALTDEQLTNERLASLYGVGVEPSLMPVQQDPLGVLSRYIFAVVEKLQPSFEHEDSNVMRVESLSLEISEPLTMTEQQVLVEKIDSLQRDLESFYPSVDIFKSGVLFFAEEAASNSKKDISFISSASAIATIVLLLSIFRNLKPLALPMVSILSGVFSAIVVSMWIFDGIHILAVVFGASLVGVVVDYSLHYFYFRWSEKVQYELPKVYKALLFSLLTSVIGYAALSLSGLAVLKQVAVFSVVGLSVSWLSVVALGERLTRKKQTLHDDYLARLVTLAMHVAGKPSPTSIACVAFFLLFLAVIFSVGQGTFLDDPRSFFAFSDERVLNEKIVASHTSSFEPSSFLLVRGKNIDNLYENIAKVRRDIGLSSALFGLDDILPSEQKQRSNFLLAERIYQPSVGSLVLNRLGLDGEQAHGFIAAGYEEFRYVEPGEIWTESNSPIPRLWFEEKGEHYALFMIAKNEELTKIRNVGDNIDSVQFFSTVENTEQALRALRQNATVLLVCACFFIYVLVALRYRSFTNGSIVFIPVVSIALSISTLQIFGGGVNFFHIMALFLVLGLGMDYVIFVREMSAHINETMRAISLSCVTSLMAFGLLGLSSMPVVQSFGLAVLIGNFCNLVGAFLLAANIGFLNNEKDVESV